ncbi:MAG: hypothetical protein AAGU27_21275 [Dehalobacterium sp.]
MGIILLVLFWVLSGTVKKKTVPRSSQPWDQARRRQSMPPVAEPERESPRPGIPFPNLQDLGKDIKEVLLEVDEDLFTRPKEAERKKTYRIKNVSTPNVIEVKAPVEEVLEPPVFQDAVSERTTLSFNDRSPIYHPQLSFGRQAVVKGIIMSEILQPPRAKRPIRR